MAAEMRRQERYASVSVFAVHPGEVATDMGDVEVDWEVKGVIEVDESVRGCLKVIEERRVEESGTFWTWEGKVGRVSAGRCRLCCADHDGRTILGDSQDISQYGARVE